MRDTTRRSVVVAALVAAASMHGRARGDDKRACATAAALGQTLRNAHGLIAARDAFLACSKSECPTIVQRDCARWLEELDKLVPTVVLSAKDRAGNDLLDVTVFIDDATVARPLDGRAIALDPGAHSFRFVRRDGSEATANALAKEGEKAVVVGVVFATPAPSSTAPIAPILPVAPPTAIGPTTAPPATAHLAPPTEGSTQRSIGWVVAGAGVVGLGAGATLGIVSIVEKGRAHCDATGACDPGPLSTLRATSLGADIALGSGVLLLAIGVPLILFSPHGEPVFVTPIVGTSSAGLAFVGAW